MHCVEGVKVILTCIVLHCAETSKPIGEGADGVSSKAAAGASQDDEDVDWEPAT